MHLHLVALLRHLFHVYGYWTVLLALLLENAGVPAPGETTLLLGSFLAFSEHSLHLRYIILVGIAAATLGDNLGYAIGLHGGRRLLNRYQAFFRLSPSRLEQAEAFFARHGAPAVFFARFIAGMRIITGPLAGALRMEWRRFFVYNFLGAAAWVTSIASVGYFFGSQMHLLVRFFKRLDLLLLAIVVVFLGGWWLRARHRKQKAAASALKS